MLSPHRRRKVFLNSRGQGLEHCVCVGWGQEEPNFKLF